MEKLGKEYLKEIAMKYGRSTTDPRLQSILDAYENGKILCTDHVESQIRSLTQKEEEIKAEVEKEYSCHICHVVFEKKCGMLMHYYIISPLDEAYKKELISYGYAILMFVSQEKCYTYALRIRPDDVGFTCW